MPATGNFKFCSYSLVTKVTLFLEDSMTVSATPAPVKTDRVSKFLEIIGSKQNRLNLERTESPKDGVSAYDYLVAMAAETPVDVPALYAGLTNGNTRNRGDRLDTALKPFGEAKEGEPQEVSSARKVLEMQKADVAWIREADKALAELRARKASIHLARSVKHWAWALDESVAQAPVVAAVELLEAYEPTEFWARKANSALNDLFKFKPICGCGCGSELTRKPGRDGKAGEGKYHKQCYKSFRAANPEQSRDDKLKADAALWGVNFIPASEVVEEFQPKKMRSGRGKPVKKAEERKAPKTPRNRRNDNAEAIADSILDGQLE